MRVLILSVSGAAAIRNVIFEEYVTEVDIFELKPENGLNDLDLKSKNFMVDGLSFFFNSAKLTPFQRISFSKIHDSLSSFETQINNYTLFKSNSNSVLQLKEANAVIRILELKNIKSIKANNNNQLCTVVQRDLTESKYDLVLIEKNFIISNYLLSMDQNLIADAVNQQYCFLQFKNSWTAKEHDIDLLPQESIFVINSDQHAVVDNWIWVNINAAEVTIKVLMPTLALKNVEHVQFLKNRYVELIKAELFFLNIEVGSEYEVLPLNGYFNNNVKPNYVNFTQYYPTVFLWSKDQIQNYFTDCFRQKNVLKLLKQKESRTA